MNESETQNSSIEEREIGDVPDFGAIQDEDSNEIMKDLTARVNSISVADREAGLHDLHGIGGIDDKSPVEEQVLVNSMRLVLSERYSSAAAEAFRMADTISPRYTRDASFLAMFLRCENYDIHAAVKRLFEFFRQKLRLFGPDKVGKQTITLSDLSADDMKCYSAGFVQLLPHRDHTGRVQFVSLPQCSTWERRENVLRMHFHLFMTALMDEETQKKGAISVVHSLNSAAFSNSKSRDPVLIWESIELVLKALPIRFVGIHICANPSSIGGKIFSSMARFVGEKGLVRVRFHQGSFDEINEKLSSFGINNILLAISHSGELKIEKHKEQLKSIKAMEHAKNLMPNKSIVLVPLSTDVLLGRGKPIQNHQGNVRLALIVESRLSEYDEIVNRLDKTKLTERTTTEMKQAGVRFLTKDSGYWELAPDRMARERVSSTFRTVRDRLKTNQRSGDARLSDSSQARKRSIEDIDDTA